MKIYLLIVVLLLATGYSQKCQQIGSSSLAKLLNCKVDSPAPRLQWSIHFTLLQDYDWKAADDIQYSYMTLDDKPINETCYTGQTIKGKYVAGTNLVVEQLCVGFNPVLSKGAKLYLLIFSSQDSSQSQAIYMTFNTSSQEWQNQPVTSEIKEKAVRYATQKMKNLLIEE